MLLNHPISDMSPNTSLLGRFPFQLQSVVSAASRVRHPTFEGYFTGLEINGHKSGLQSRGHRLTLKRVERGFKTCAFVLPARGASAPADKTRLLYALCAVFVVAGCHKKDPRAGSSHRQQLEMHYLSPCVPLVAAS